MNLDNALSYLWVVQSIVILYIAIGVKVKRFPFFQRMAVLTGSVGYLVAVIGRLTGDKVSRLVGGIILLVAFVMVAEYIRRKK